MEAADFEERAPHEGSCPCFYQNDDSEWAYCALEDGHDGQCKTFLNGESVEWGG